MITALVVIAVILFAAFALFIAWWDIRGWLHDVDLGDLGDIEAPSDHELRLTPREWDQIHAPEAGEQRRINGSCGHPNHGHGDHECAPFLHDLDDVAREFGVTLPRNPRLNGEP